MNQIIIMITIICLFIVAFVVVGAADAAVGVSIANDAEVLSSLVTCDMTDKLLEATLNTTEVVVMLYFFLLHRLGTKRVLFYPEKYIV